MVIGHVLDHKIRLLRKLLKLYYTVDSIDSESIRELFTDVETTLLLKNINSKYLWIYELTQFRE